MYRVPEGLSYTFREQSRSDNQLTISGGGQQGQVQQVVTTTLAGAARVVSVADGRPTRINLKL